MTEPAPEPMSVRAAPSDSAAADDSGASRALLFVIIAVGLALRLVHLGTTNLWLDEANSWFVATFPYARILGDLQAIPGAAFHAPAYFVALKAWMAGLGDSEAAMRGLAMLMSVVLIPVTYALGVRVLSREAALLGVLILAVSPAQVFFAQEVRMYAAVTLLTTGAALAMVLWWDARTGARRVAALALYASLAALALYTHFTAALVLAALSVHALAALAARGGRRFLTQRRVWEWAVAQLVVAAVFAPYFLGIDREAATGSQSWRSPLGWEGAVRELLRYPLELVSGVYHGAPEFRQRALDFWRDMGGPKAATRLRESLIVFPLLVLALTGALARPPRAQAGAVPLPRTLIYFALLLPLAVGVLVSVRQGLDFSRYFLFCTPYLALLIGGGLAAMRREAAILASSVILLAAVFGFARYWQVDDRDSDYRPVARYLEERVRPGDDVLAVPTDNHVSLLYYLRRAPIRTRGLPPGTTLKAALDAAAARTWLVMDYRTPHYDMSPRRLSEELGRDPTLQRRFGPGGSAGVLVVAVDPR